MTLFLTSLVVMLLYGLSAYGWGQSTTRFFYGDALGWVFTTVLGVAIWIFVGGVLNLLHLVNAYTLFAITGFGLGVSAASLYSAWRDRRNTIVMRARSLPIGTPWIRYLKLVPFVIVLVILAFLVIALMPTYAFNFHDDMHTYMMRPVRMLQTGTVGGNPFDVLGLDSLGAQAFLHAFVVAYFHPAFLNGMDAIFCFTLGGLLLLEMGRRMGAGWGIATLALLAFIVIHPQSVNISALYSGILMALGMVYASLLMIEPRDADSTKPLARRTIPPALFTAALLALKTTFVFFTVVYWVLFFSTLLVMGSDRRRILKIGAFLVLAGVALIAPWVALHAPNYLSALALDLAAPGTPPSTSLSFGGDIADLFSNKKLFWGGNLRDYLVIALLLVAAFGIVLWSLWRNRGGAPRAELVAALAVAGAAPATYLLNGYFFDFKTGVRYSAPILIVGLSVTAILLARLVPTVSIMQRNIFRAAIAIALATVLVLFSGSFLDRLKLARDGRTLVSFPMDMNYYHYMADALGELAQRWASKAQLETEEGATILAWISVPFQLDFPRNRIFVVSEPGLANPWLHLPIGADSDVLRAYLRTYGIRYVFLEYGGYGVKTDSDLEAYVHYPAYRKIGEANLYFRKTLLELAKNSRVVGRDRRSVLYEITDDGSVNRP